MEKIVINDNTLNAEVNVVNKSALEVCKDDNVVLLKSYDINYIKLVIDIVVVSHGLNRRDANILYTIIKQCENSPIDGTMLADVVRYSNYPRTSVVLSVDVLKKAGFIKCSILNKITLTPYITTMIKTKREVGYVVIEVNNHSKLK